MKLGAFLNKLANKVVLLDNDLHNGLKTKAVPITLNTTVCSSMAGNCYYYPSLRRVFIEMRFTRKITTTSGKQRLTVGTIADPIYRPGLQTALNWSSSGWDAASFSKRESTVTSDGEIIIAQYNASNPSYWYISGSWLVDLRGGVVYNYSYSIGIWRVFS